MIQVASKVQYCLFFLSIHTQYHTKNSYPTHFPQNSFIPLPFIPYPRFFPPPSSIFFHLTSRAIYILYNQKKKMGCEQSRLNNFTSIPLSIVDSAFLKAENQQVKAILLKRSIVPNVYMNIDCFLQSLDENYSNNVVVRAQDYKDLLAALKSARLSPHVYVLGQPLDASAPEEKATYFSSYKQLPQVIEKAHESSTKTVKMKNSRVDVRILKDFKSEAQSQLFIFEETLKVKNITYEFYNSFDELQSSHTSSQLLVIDYKFHREAIALGVKSKIICYCDLAPQQKYDPQVFFITNNFQEIVNEIMIFKKLTQPILPISKIYFYSNGQILQRHVHVFEHFNLRVKMYSNLSELIKTTRLYFSVMVICREEDQAEVQKKVKEEGCSFRIRVIPISEEAESSPCGLRKAIREVKRGYLVERTSAKVVDIIDKYHSNIKFQEIKKALTKNNIQFRCYSSVVEYCRKLNFISPVVICNFDDRLLLHRFLEEVQIKTKILIFCNRAKITEQLSRDTRWHFVSSHFGKIIKYIKTHHVLYPIIFDKNQQKLQQKQENMKSKQHRISAIKWAEQAQNSKAAEQSFIIAKSDASPQTLKELAYQTSSFLKLPYSPKDNIQNFRKDLIESLKILTNQYRLNILESELGSLVEEIKKASLQQLMMRSRQFLGEGKEMGISLNKTLRTLQKLKEDDFKHIKETIFSLLLNFLSCYELPTSESTSLCCWTKETSFDLCEAGNLVLSKNFLVMREEGEVEKIPGCIKLQIDLDYNTIDQVGSPLNSYFLFQGRFVFAPYTQLKITQIDCENETRVIHLKLVKDNYFLQKYFSDNLAEDINGLFEKEVAKEKSTMIDQCGHTTVSTNLQRMKAIKLWNSGQAPAAATIQRQIISSHEQDENISAKLLTDLKFQLAVYLSSEQSNNQQIYDLIAQIKDSSPTLYIKRRCATMLAKLRNHFEKLGRPSSQAKTIKCIELKQEIEKTESQQQDDDVSPIQDIAQYDNLFQCLQLDQKQGLAQHFS